MHFKAIARAKWRHFCKLWSKFRAKPHMGSISSFHHCFWFFLSFRMMVGAMWVPKVNSSTLCYSWGPLCHSRVSAFEKCWIKYGLDFSFIWSLHSLDRMSRTHVILIWMTPVFTKFLIRDAHMRRSVLHATIVLKFVYITAGVVIIKM